MHRVIEFFAAPDTYETSVDITWIIPVFILIVTVTGMLFLARASSRYVARRAAAIPGRSSETQGVAHARGWGYQDVDLSGARSKYFSAYPFVSNTPETPRDIVWGTVDGRPFETFLLSLSDNTFISGSVGKTRMMSNDFQVTWIPLPGPLPRIKLTLNDSVSQRLAALGEQEVDVESFKFNEIWSVYSHDARITHAVLQPRMIARLLRPDVSSLEFTFEGGALMTSVPYATPLAQVDSLVRTLYELADLVPRFLFEDRSGGQPEGGGKAIQ